MLELLGAAMSPTGNAKSAKGMAPREGSGGDWRGLSCQGPSLYLFQDGFSQRGIASSLVLSKPHIGGSWMEVMRYLVCQPRTQALSWWGQRTRWKMHGPTLNHEKFKVITKFLALKFTLTLIWRDSWSYMVVVPVSTHFSPPPTTHLFKQHDFSY